jgi:hypothetical protein
MLITAEIGLVHQSLKAKITEVQLMAGIAQVAKELEVKKYLFRGLGNSKICDQHPIKVKHCHCINFFLTRLREQLDKQFIRG